LAAWLFPLLCWGVATLYLGGSLGKNTDDYALNLRDPATNAIPSPFNPLRNYPYFWRPLHNTMCFGVGTFFPGADRSVHLAVALFHGLATLGLYLLLRELTRTRLAPALAATLFMVLPLHFEVAFWFSTTSTAIGATLFFAAALVAVRFARQDCARPALLPLIAGLVFLVTCFYEQSASPAAALPAICLAVAPGTQRWRDRLARAVLATGAAGAACVLYIALLTSTAPAKARGGSGSLVKPERLVARLSELLGGIKHTLVGERATQLVRGSFRLGWETVASPTGLVVGSMLLAAGTLWLAWAARRGGSAATSVGVNSPPRSGWTFAAGAIVFAAGWLPVCVIDHQNVENRLTYVPLLGAAMMLGSLLDALFWATACVRPCAASTVRALTTAAAFAGIAPGVICLVGSQAYFQRRSRQDQREIAALKDLIPNPPANTVFVPFRTDATAAHTGILLFDRARYGVFETPWSAHAAIRLAYRRDDLGATSYNPWSPPPRTPVDKPGADGVRWTRGLSREMEKLFPADPEGGVRIAWANMVPFVTDDDGQLRLIRRVDVERADHRDLEIRPPMVHAAIDARRGGGIVPTTTYQIMEAAANSRPDLIPINFWHSGDGKAAVFQKGVRPFPTASAHDATWLAAGAGPRDRMSVRMPPLDRPGYLLIRATIGEFDLNPKRNPIVAVQELVVSMAGAPEKELATLRIDPAKLRGLKKWLPLVVTIPARDGTAGDRVVVAARRTRDLPVRTDPADHTPIPADCTPAILPVWVTSGYEQSIGPVP
jgi:hypothetical protein